MGLVQKVQHKTQDLINKAGKVGVEECPESVNKNIGQARAGVMRDNHPGVRPGWLSREYRLVGARVRQTVV